MRTWQADMSQDAELSRDRTPAVSLSAGSGGSRPKPVLEVADLTVGYGGAPIISDLSLTVGEGEVVTIVGPNGAGKSTLVKSVIGELHPSSGTVALQGNPVTNVPTELLVRRGIAYVPQRNDVFGMLTVRENLEMGGYLLSKRELSSRIGEALSHFPKLEELARRRVTVSKLSGGERKMLAFARALMTRPSVLVLDEPTAGLAVQIAKNLLHEQIPALVSQGVSMLLVEQRAADALEVSDWAYVLVAGRVEISASAAEVLGREDIGQIFLGKAAADSA